jgi:hypothetical protein
MALLIGPFRLAVFHHAAVRADFHIATGVFDVLLSLTLHSRPSLAATQNLTRLHGGDNR